MRSMLHQSAAEIAPSRSTKNYTKVSAASALFCAQFLLDYLLLQRFILRAIF